PRNPCRRLQCVVPRGILGSPRFCHSMSFRLAKQFFRHQRLKRAGIVAELDVHAIAPGGLRGGWTVHPDVLSKDSIVYAFGVGSNIEWDKEMVRRFGLTLHAFDPTP